MSPPQPVTGGTKGEVSPVEEIHLFTQQIQAGRYSPISYRHGYFQLAESVIPVTGR